MTAPLLSALAVAELTAQAIANLLHTATVAETADSGRTWSTVTGGTTVPCRLMRPGSRSPGESRGQGGEVERLTSDWVVAFAAGSPFAAPRLRLTITGTDHGTTFTREVYTVGALQPVPQACEARVYAVEDPQAAFAAGP